MINENWFPNCSVPIRYMDDLKGKVEKLDPFSTLCSGPEDIRLLIYNISIARFAARLVPKIISFP